MVNGFNKLHLFCSGSSSQFSRYSYKLKHVLLIKKMMMRQLNSREVAKIIHEIYKNLKLERMHTTEQPHSPQ
jgi:hypothetical protein